MRGCLNTIDNLSNIGYTNYMTETQEEVKRQLKLADRCDRCDAQAFILAKGVSGELYFCGHHYNKHEDAINKFAFEIIDERQYINAKPTAAY